jgi:hypothetical protein
MANFGLSNSFTGGEDDGFKEITKKPEQKQAQDTGSEVIEEKTSDNVEDLGFKKIDPKPDKGPEKQPESQPEDLSDEKFLEYINKKNKTEFKSLEDYQNSFSKQIEKEVVKEVNPWADVMGPEDEAFFKFKKETGRGRKEWEFLNQDISKLSPLDIAREKVRKETGMDNLTNEQLDEHLENELNISLTGDLETSELIKLNAYVKSYKESLIAQQETYKKPLQEHLERQSKQKAANEPLMMLPDGRTVTKSEYEAEINKSKDTYLQKLTQGLNSVSSSEFKVVFEDTGEKREVEFNYEFSDEDKHSMLSGAKDLDATIEKRFATKDGLDHKALAESFWWGDKANQQKVIQKAMQQARAMLLEELAKRSNNENFGFRTMPKRETTKEGYGSLTERGSNSGRGQRFGLKW